MPEAFVILAKSYYKLGSYNEAIAELEKWLTYSETIKEHNFNLLPEVYYYLGFSYSKIPGDACKALENFRMLKNKYRESEFYRAKGISSDIEQKISDCEKACNSILK